VLACSWLRRSSPSFPLPYSLASETQSLPGLIEKIGEKFHIGDWDCFLNHGSTINRYLVYAQAPNTEDYPASQPLRQPLELVSSLPSYNINSGPSNEPTAIFSSPLLHRSARRNCWCDTRTPFFDDDALVRKITMTSICTFVLVHTLFMLLLSLLLL
jgi:hypothetical protein